MESVNINTSTTIPQNNSQGIITEYHNKQSLSSVSQSTQYHRTSQPQIPVITGNVIFNKYRLNNWIIPSFTGNNHSLKNNAISQINGVTNINNGQSPTIRILLGLFSHSFHNNINNSSGFRHTQRRIPMPLGHWPLTIPLRRIVTSLSHQ